MYSASRPAHVLLGHLAHGELLPPGSSMTTGTTAWSTEARSTAVISAPWRGPSTLARPRAGDRTLEPCRTGPGSPRSTSTWTRSGCRPNLRDDPAFRATFTWDQARAELEGLPGGGSTSPTSASTATLASHAASASPCDGGGAKASRVELTYGELADATSRFADVLDTLGVARGERVFMLTGRIPELYTAVLGTLKHGSVACTLFSAFGPEPIRQRLELGDARVLVTTSTLYRRKVAPIRAELPGLRHVVVVDDDGDDDSDVLSTPVLARAANTYPRRATPHPTDMALLHFTSGTTGMPKGAVHVHEAIAAHRATARWALDLHDDDMFWCTADPGWVTGMSYGILAPLALGVTSVVDEADFDADPLVRAAASRTSHRLVHRSDRDADDDAGRGTSWRMSTLAPTSASSPAWASR